MKSLSLAAVSRQSCHLDTTKMKNLMISLQTTPAPPLQIYLQESQYLPIYLTQHMKAKSWTKKRKLILIRKTNMAGKMDAIHNVIQTIMSLINKPQPSQDDPQQPKPATLRTKTSDFSSVQPTHTNITQKKKKKKKK
jgi:hypothetical protein